MALVNLEFAIARRNELKRDSRIAEEAAVKAFGLVESADAEIARHVALVQCLRTFGPFGDGLTERVQALLLAIEKGEVFA
jgi:hypothetical protein